jgi:SAM-dependent methyltransferase
VSRFEVRTRYPLAAESVDHLHPRGTKNDNSTNLEFNRRLFDLVTGRRAVLDLGCSGGGFVRSILEMGGQACGIEGSDYSKIRARAAWSEIPQNLFTADIARPFLVLSDGLVGRFNVLTMWEVLEHLNANELEQLAVNVHANLAPAGLFIGSVTTAQDRCEGIDYHATVRPADWWSDFFVDHGFIERPDLFDHFAPHWVRGSNTDGPQSSNFVLQKP